jgi:polyphosphate kinase 2 (PPK2 family)
MSAQVSSVASMKDHSFAGHGPAWRAFTASPADDPSTAVDRLAERVATEVEKLYANARFGSRQRMLVVVQGLDASGKGGAIKRLLRHAAPESVAVTRFGPPTPAEKQEHFLDRIRRALPTPGSLMVFDRSHYEDVIMPFVTGSMSELDIRTRLQEINQFEFELASSGCVIVKCLLNVSREVQRDRLLRRLSDQTSQWHTHEGEIREHRRWHRYQEAYAEILSGTTTVTSPWHVIDADDHLHLNVTFVAIVADALGALGLTWPAIGNRTVDQLRELLLSSDDGDRSQGRANLVTC